jgi:glycosyltransferase involved in cell wall biosynthesis
MTGSGPRLSVIIPVFNGEAYLAAAVESVRRQACVDLEVIVVDDGSTDGTAGVVSRLPQEGLRYVHQENGGPARARNHGIRLASGDLIGFLDADDVWPADRLGHQLRALERDPSADLVLGWTRLAREMAGADGRPHLEAYGPAVVFLTPTAALFRRRVFERVGGFDETLRFGEDTDWFMRARELGVPILVEDEVVLLYRRHEHNMTRGQSLKALRVLDVLKMSLDRRRQRGGEAAPLPSLLHGRPRPEGRVDPTESNDVGRHASGAPSPQRLTEDDGVDDSTR